MPFARRCRYASIRSVRELKVKAKWKRPAALGSLGPVPGSPMMAMRWCSSSYARKHIMGFSNWIVAEKKVL